MVAHNCSHFEVSEKKFEHLLKSASKRRWYRRSLYFRFSILTFELRNTWAIVLKSQSSSLQRDVRAIRSGVGYRRKPKNFLCAGVLIPSFKVGAAFGRMVGEGLHLWFPNGVHYGSQGLSKCFYFRIFQNKRFFNYFLFLF